jgi:uncharacterized protein YodC (DUF2158 family)
MASDDLSDDVPFEIGAVVRLRSGSPPMTVAGYLTRNGCPVVELRFFDGDGNYGGIEAHPAMLEETDDRWKWDDGDSES